MCTTLVVIGIEASCNTMDDGHNGDEPCSECSEVEAACVPVWTLWISGVQRWYMNVAFTHNEIIGAEDVMVSKIEFHIREDRFTSLY